MQIAQARSNTSRDFARDIAAPIGTGMRLSHWFFAAVMIGLGVIGLVEGDFALVWQRIPIDDLPGRQVLAYLCAGIELGTGIGLLFRRTGRLASRILVVYLLLWVVLLKLPAVIMVPQMEATWLGFGEISVILAGAWILFAARAGVWESRHLKFAVGADGVRKARLLFAICLPMIGLSHFVYSTQTADFVPAWLPFRLAWAYLTGAGNIAAGIALLFGIQSRLAATLEAAMLGIITVLVWAPGIGAGPTDRLHVTGFLISSAIACGAWVVADSYRAMGWLASGR
jgi:uncharacterized membrane protein